MDALKKQIGGQHYKDCSPQPIEFIEGNTRTPHPQLVRRRRECVRCGRRMTTQESEVRKN